MPRATIHYIRDSTKEEDGNSLLATYRVGDVIDVEGHRSILLDGCVISEEEEGVIDKTLAPVMNFSLHHWNDAFPVDDIEIPLSHTGDVRFEWLDNTRCIVHISDAFKPFRLYVYIAVEKDRRKSDTFLVSRESIIKDVIKSCNITVTDPSGQFDEIPFSATSAYLVIDCKFKSTETFIEKHFEPIVSDEEVSSEDPEITRETMRNIGISLGSSDSDESL